MPWPLGEANVSLLCEDSEWPLATGFVDRLILMHGLETSDNAAAVLEECFRVLGPGGRVLFIVPNRLGLWARGDGTPFGFGRPYSMGQIEAELKRHGFTPERAMTALFAPPSLSRFWLRTAGFWEWLGRAAPWLELRCGRAHTARWPAGPRRKKFGLAFSGPGPVTQAAGFGQIAGAVPRRRL
jgi:SAM-dependent methyltransferase